jgi:hypothetical protein
LFATSSISNSIYDIGLVHVNVLAFIVQLQLGYHQLQLLVLSTYLNAGATGLHHAHHAAVIAAHSVVFQLPNIKSLIASCTQAFVLIQFSVSAQDQLPPEVAIVHVALPLPSMVNSYTQGVVGLLGTLLPAPDGVYGVHVITHPTHIVRI